VARLARLLGVGALQRKYNLVIEIRQVFASLVTRKACRAIVRAMLLYKTRIYPSVARRAHSLRKVVTRRNVTIRADKRRAVCPARMIGQREPNLMVWKGRPRSAIEIRIATLVLTVAQHTSLGIF
jgi:hypothetical protein